jgi:hypothetical protein
MVTLTKPEQHSSNSNSPNLKRTASILTGIAFIQFFLPGKFWNRTVKWVTTAFCIPF